MIRYVKGLILIAVLLSIPVTGRAQVRPGGPPGQPAPRQELERRVMQGLAQIIKEQLGLSQDEFLALQETMQSFREDRRALAMEQASLRHRLRDPALEEVAPGEAMEILNGLVRAQEDELALYKKEQTELLTVLSPAQLVQFYRIRDEWGQRIQQMRQRRRPGGPPGGLSPNPGGSGRGPGGSDDGRGLELTLEDWLFHP